MQTTAQLELDLVIAAASPLTRQESDRVGLSLRAVVAWVCEPTAARVKETVPAWFAAMKRRAMALAKAVRDACLSLAF